MGLALPLDAGVWGLVLDAAVVSQRGWTLAQICFDSLEIQGLVGTGPQHFPSQDTGCSERWDFGEAEGSKAVPSSSRSKLGTWWILDFENALMGNTCRPHAPPSSYPATQGNLELKPVLSTEEGRIAMCSVGPVF